ncbi:MAG: UDP-N-acetylglucosamine 1-carboxyvinyltransferase [Candidatus Vogelbacteria bacterium]|nr:UDP-N-acetylglucosamine 1-carboxyvinyltransferase [Candidatus Vogelbacteria bacterium]
MVAGNTLIIEGTAGRQVINGSIRVNGSKNDAVQAIASSFLFKNGLTLTNLPAIDDVQKMLLLAEGLGARIERHGRQTMIAAPKRLSIRRGELDSAIAEKIRASILLTGPLIARYGSVTFPHPGGCVIGERPIDFFLAGFTRMGASVKGRRGSYVVSAPRRGLRGAAIFFKNQSVTATETFLMAAVLARGRTSLKNCALEPEITNLGRFLRRAGAEISGLGTPTIVVNGRGLLIADRPYQVLPDRIEAGSFAILGALLAKELRITHCRPQHLEALLNLLIELGAKVKSHRDLIIISAPQSRLRAVKIKTHEYPGFPTDLQAPLAILLTQAYGASVILETIFEGRLNYAKTLISMGAKIKIFDPHRLAIVGPTPLVGREVTSPDLRAGLAYLLAGLVAKGRTVVHNVHYIDRGYERIDERLGTLGLELKRF